MRELDEAKKIPDNLHFFSGSKPINYGSISTIFIQQKFG